MFFSCRLKFEEADFGSGSDTTLLEPPKEFQAGEKDLGAVFLVPHFVVAIVHPIAVLAALSHLLLKMKIKQSWSICCVSFSQLFSVCLSILLPHSLPIFSPFIHSHSISHRDGCMHILNIPFAFLSCLYLDSKLKCTG